jgi:hypothetical protein
LTAVGHAILRSIAIGQGDPLRSAAGALERLERLLPNASAEGRLVATLMAISSDHPSQPVVTSPAPHPSPTRRKSKSAKPVKQTRKGKAAVPIMDINGRLLPSREVNGIAVVSQAEARKALGMSCIQMLKLENQKLLTRIQEGESRLVFYSISEVQRLFDLVSGGADPVIDDDGAPTEGVA